MTLHFLYERILMIRLIKDDKTKDNWAIEVDKENLNNISNLTNIREKSFYENKQELYCSLISDGQLKQIVGGTLIALRPKKKGVEEYISESLTAAYNTKLIKLRNELQDVDDLKSSDSNLYKRYARKKMKEEYNISNSDIEMYLQNLETVEELESKLTSLQISKQLIDQDVITKSIEEYLKIKYGKELIIDDKYIADNLNNLSLIEREHFRKNGYELSSTVINSLQESYNNVGKYGELIRLISSLKMNASLKKEFLLQIFVNNISEYEANYLLLTNEFKTSTEIVIVIKEYTNYRQFTVFEQLMIKALSKATGNELKMLYSKLADIEGTEEKVKYLENRRIRNSNVELSNVEKELIKHKYEIKDSTIDELQNLLIVMGSEPTLEKIDNSLKQLNVVLPQYTRFEMELINLITNVSSEEELNLYNELNGLKDIRKINELRIKYDKSSEDSIINSELRKALIAQAKYSETNLNEIENQLKFKGFRSTLENIELVASELHIEDSTLMHQITKLLNDTRETIIDKSVNEQIEELLSENQLLTTNNKELEIKLKEFKQKQELHDDIAVLIEDKNSKQLECEKYDAELKLREKDVLKLIADKLSIKFDVEIEGNFNELLDEIIQKNNDKYIKPKYICKKKFGIKNNQFKSNKELSNLEEFEKIELYSVLDDYQLMLLGSKNMEEYVAEVVFN